MVATASPVTLSNRAPSTPKLTAERRREYEALGYVIVPDVFPAAELDSLDAEIDSLMDSLLAERRKRGAAAGALGNSHHEETGSILQLGLRSPVCQRFAEDGRILNLIEDIVQPGIAIYSVKLIAKPPFTDIPCHWHQDDAYYVKQSQSQTRMSVWAPLQTAHEANGCLWVVPKSHLWGLQEHANKSHGQCRLSMNDQEIEAVLREQAIPVPVQAGAAVLFSALLWHGSRGNQTDAVRRAFIISYQEATVPKGNGEQWKVLRPA